MPSYTVFMYSYKDLPSCAPQPPAAPASIAPGAPQRRLLAQLHEQLRYLHYSLRAEEAYLHWVRAFVRWSGLRHPRQMGAAEVQAFLAWLATERQVSVSTHRQRKARLPTVLSVAEVCVVLALLEGRTRCPATVT
jgi:hypothetical protein